MRELPPAARGNPAAREAEIAKLPEPDRKEIGETFGKVFGLPGGLAGYMPHLREAVRHLKTVRQETTGQKVACVGFCMGGGLSALLAYQAQPYFTEALLRRKKFLPLPAPLSASTVRTIRGSIPASPHSRKPCAARASPMSALCMKGRTILSSMTTGRLTMSRQCGIHSFGC